MIGLRLSPVDTWFFRDAGSFEAGGQVLSPPGGRFPPGPATVAGAVRAAIAASNGWSGTGRWPGEIGRVLGDGPDDFGMLKVIGPFPTVEDELLFPLPAHILGTVVDGSWRPAGVMAPGDALDSDLGSVRFPVFTAPENGVAYSGLEEGWCTGETFTRLLAGDLSGNGPFRTSADLATLEPRVGIKRSESTRTVIEGHLYTVKHVRPRPTVAIAVLVSGIPDDWEVPDGMVMPLGGEGRMAYVETWNPAGVPVGSVEGLQYARRLLIVAVTPTRIPDLRPLGELAGVEGATVVSGVSHWPDRIGGWDSLNHRPVPASTYLKPGSVIFCELSGAAWQPNASQFEGSALAHLGERTAAGFGLVAFGTW